MHLDEIAHAADGLTFAVGSEYSAHADRLIWQWTSLSTGDLSCHRMRITFDSDGHMFALAEVDARSSALRPDALEHLATWGREVYLEIVSHWTALHADVLRGVVKIGHAAVLGRMVFSGVHVTLAQPAGLQGRSFGPERLRQLLMTEACRTFIYSTTGRFREFGRELERLRDEVINGPISHGERVSVTANQRIEDGRTIRSRLEIAVQTIRNRLDHYPQQVKHVRRDLEDLILVAEHMQTVWVTQERNFEWVVQHVNLRVGIAERAATRSFTAAVFAVAVVAVMRDVVDTSLTAGVIAWSQYRAMVLVLGCLGVMLVSYLLYLVAKRLIR
jgi:hypothetical protein